MDYEEPDGSADVSDLINDTVEDSEVRRRPRFTDFPSSSPDICIGGTRVADLAEKYIKADDKKRRSKKTKTHFLSSSTDSL